MIRILIADDQKMVREGIISFLEPHNRLEVVGTAKDGLETIVKVEILQPDIVLLGTCRKIIIQSSLSISL